jgi:hypothetical protein
MSKYHYAEVIDNNDILLQAGRVQIKIPYLHNEVSNDLLPWAKQMSAFTGGSDSHGKSYIPEIGSRVWVIFENEVDMLKPFYIADVHLNQFNPHTLFNDNVSSEISGFSSIYPDVKYEYYANGICIGVSSSLLTPEIFIYHPSGSHVFIDTTGKININSAIGVEIKSGIIPTQQSILGEQLKTTLETLCTAIAAITVTCAAPGSPSSVPINAATFTTIKSSLTSILSQLNKNN